MLRVVLFVMSILFIFMGASVSAQNIHPQWSSEGLTWYERIDNSAKIWVLKTGETVPTNVTENAFYNANPSWSPDGKSLVYASGRPGMRGQWDIVIQNIVTGKETQILDDLEREMHPSWSPNGEWIAFIRMADGGSDIYRIRPDGTGLEAITQTDGTEFHVKWGPQGKLLAYDGASGTDGKGRAIYILNPKSGERLTITHAQRPNFVAAPSIAPNGESVTWGEQRDGVSRIMIANIDGTNIRALINAPDGAVLGGTYWSPDGTKIAFHMNSKAGYGIYTMALADKKMHLVWPKASE